MAEPSQARGAKPCDSVGFAEQAKRALPALLALPSAKQCKASPASVGLSSGSAALPKAMQAAQNRIAALPRFAPLLGGARQSKKKRREARFLPRMAWRFCAMPKRRQHSEHKRT